MHDGSQCECMMAHKKHQQSYTINNHNNIRTPTSYTTTHPSWADPCLVLQSGCAGVAQGCVVATPQGPHSHWGCDSQGPGQRGAQGAPVLAGAGRMPCTWGICMIQYVHACGVVHTCLL